MEYTLGYPSKMDGLKTPFLGLSLSDMCTPTENRPLFRFQDLEGWDRARSLGVPLPEAQVVIGSSDQEGMLRVYTIVDKIHGDPLGYKHRDSRFPADVLDDSLYHMFEYFKDVYRNGGPFWCDLTKPWEMFMYGRRKGECKDQVWLVDLDFQGILLPSASISIISIINEYASAFLFNSFDRKSVSYPKTSAKMIELLNLIPKDDEVYSHAQLAISRIK